MPVLYLLSIDDLVYIVSSCKIFLSDNFKKKKITWENENEINDYFVLWSEQIMLEIDTSANIMQILILWLKNIGWKIHLAIKVVIITVSHYVRSKIQSQLYLLHEYDFLEMTNEYLSHKLGIVVLSVAQKIC